MSAWTRSTTWRRSPTSPGKRWDGIEVRFRTSSLLMRLSRHPEVLIDAPFRVDEPRRMNGRGGQEMDAARPGPSPFEARAPRGRAWMCEARERLRVTVLARSKLIIRSADEFGRL